MGRDAEVDSEEELTGSLKPFTKKTAASKAAENAGKPKPKPKAKGTARTSVAGKVCAAENCSQHCSNGKPACSLHIPAWDNMRYQALKKNDKEGDKEAWELWTEINKPENRMQLTEEMTKHMKDVPMDSRYRRWPMLDTAQWKKSFGKRTGQITDLQRKPFTKAAFLRWAIDKQGLTESQATAWWMQCHEDPSILRDNTGYEGAEVLYICKGKVLTNRSELYIDGACETGSKMIKNPKDKDITALKNFAHESVESHGSEFFRSAGLTMPSAGADDDTKPKSIEWDTAKLATEVPKLHTTFEKVIFSLCQESTKVLRKSETIMQQIKDYGIELTVEDRALTNMCQNLLLRNHLLLRWEGSHPCASLKLIFHSAKVELDTESPSKKARLTEATLASAADTCAGIATKLEATSPSQSQGNAQAEMQDDGSGEDEVKRMQKMIGIAQTEMQSCMDEDERNETTDGKVRKKKDAANSKWRDLMRVWETVNPLLSIRQVVEKYPRQKPFKEDVNEFMTMKEMEAMIAEMFTTIDSVASYDAINAKFTSSKAIQQQMTKHLGIQCTDIKSYIQNINRRVVRAEEATRKKAQAECATRATDVAEEAAEKARKTIEEDGSLAQALAEAVGIFSFVRQDIYSDLLPRVASVSQVGCIGSDAFPLSKPFMIGRENEAMAQQLGNAALLKVLKWWGSNHTTTKDFKAENRAQFPLKEKKGLEQANAILGSMNINCVDISNVSSSFIHAGWMTAYSQKMRFVGMNSNFSAQVRWLSAGSLSVLMFEIKSLEAIVIENSVGTSSPIGQGDMSMQMLIAAVQACESFETLSAWMGRGLKIFLAEQSVGDVLYMPMGYLVLEITPTEDDDVDKEILTYGGRKNFFPLHQSCSDALVSTIDLLRNDKVDVSRLEEVHEIIKERVLQSEEADAGERG